MGCRSEHERLDLRSFCGVAKGLLTDVMEKKGSCFSISLRGGLGVGKTTFSREIVECMCGGGCFLGSPTYGIVHEYRCSDSYIYHVDLYRVTSLLEVRELGFYSLFEGNIVIVEWPEVLGGSIKFDVDIEITMSNPSGCENNLRNVNVMLNF